MRFASRLAAMALAVCTGLAVSDPARAEVDFSGRTISIVVGFGAGGGYDALGRLAADHLGQFLPGKPTVIVENMPGGGGRRALVYMAKVAPRDGTVITIPTSNFAVDALMGDTGEAIDPTAFAMIGRIAEARQLRLTWETSPTKTFADAQNRETTMASEGPTSNTSVVLRVLNAYFGTRFKPIEGYSGTAEMALAMERGEVEGALVSPQVAAGHPEWFAEGKVNVLWQEASDRSPAFPDVPALVEFATNDADRALLELVVSQGRIGKSLAAPPGVPDDVVAAFRDAYAAMIKDPAFLADAEKRKLDILPGTAAELDAIVAATIASDPATSRRFAAATAAAAE